MNKRKKQMLLAGAITVLVLLTVFRSGQARYSLQQQPDTSIGAQSPAFALDNLQDRQSIAVKPGKQRRPILLNFWASWCEPCIREMPLLNLAYSQYAGQADLIAVNVTGKDELSQVAEFAAKHGITMPILLDRQMSVSEMYRIVQLPTTYVIDRNGRIADRVIGPLNEDKLQSILQKLLQ